MRRITLILAVLVKMIASHAIAATVRVHADHPQGKLEPIWRFFGADEPNYAYMKNGNKLLGELGKLRPEQVYFRADNLLTSGDGTAALKWGSTNAYTEDASGNAVYDWTIVDRIFDAYRANRVRPYVQIGFMPEALSSKPQPYRHHWTPKAKYEEIYTGWAYPPKDYEKWGKLAEAWAKHCVERYGIDEVKHWSWQVWNEANIGYWRGTPQEFHKLHDHAIAGVRRAIPDARVGGPDVAGSGGKFMRGFLEHCLRGVNFATGENGTPLDFVSFHSKGAPKFVDGHVRMGMAEQLRTIDEGFRIIASYPELKDKPIVIGESDPDGCAACQGPQLGYRNDAMYSSYTAASFARKHDLAAKHGVKLEGALTWAFTFEDQPFFAGFRQLASNGIDLPVMNVFRMFAKMGGERVATESDGQIALDAILTDGVRGAADIGTLASRDERRLSILIWHYHDDDLAGDDAEIRIQATGLPGDLARVRLQHFRIDGDHSNAYSAWKALGSPQQPTPQQYERLERAGQLAQLNGPKGVEVSGGGSEITFPLPRQAVSLLILDW